MVEEWTMTTAKIVTSLLAALLAYVGFELSNTGSEDSAPDTPQQQDCMITACATMINLPPSSCLFF